MGQLRIGAALATSLALSSGPAWAMDSSHQGLIACQEQNNLDTKCRLKMAGQELIGRQNVHSTFTISYDMRCDAAFNATTPTAIRLVVEKEGGDQHIEVLNYKTQKSFDVDGFGQIKIEDTNPQNLYARKFFRGCDLDILITTKKSARTLADESRLLAEIGGMIADTRRDADETFRLMVAYRADISAIDGNKAAVACLIKRWESDPLYTEIIDDLSATYAMTFREAYTQDVCSEEVLPPTPNLSRCPADDLTKTCIYTKAYFATRDKLEGICTKLDSMVQSTDSNAASRESLLAILSDIRNRLREF